MAAAAIGALEANSQARQELAAYLEGGKPPGPGGARPPRPPGGGAGEGRGGPPPPVVQAFAQQLAQIHALSNEEFEQKKDEIARGLLQEILGLMRRPRPGGGGLQPGQGTGGAEGPLATGPGEPSSEAPTTDAGGPSPSPPTAPVRPQIGTLELPAEEPTEGSQREQLEQALREEFRNSQELYKELKDRGVNLETVDELIHEARDALNAGTLVEAGESLKSAITIMKNLREQAAGPSTPSAREPSPERSSPGEQPSEAPSAGEPPRAEPPATGEPPDALSP